jgi:hypothetical protein
MNMRKVVGISFLSVCLVIGLAFGFSTAASAGEHTVVLRPVPKSEFLPRGAQTTCLYLEDDCGDGEGSNEWSYICERGDYQAWFGFDVSEVPDGATINSITFNALMYTESGSAERTLWYDSDDSWIGSETCPGNKGLTELVGTVLDSDNEPAWELFTLDLSQHNWANDLADNYITLMLTGPYNGDHHCGAVFLSESGSGPCLIITYDSARPIPTLSEWGIIIFSLMLAGSAILMMRRRQVS